MAPKKPNPLLAKLSAQLEAQHAAQSAAQTELHMIAMLIAANKELRAGPARSGFFLAEFAEAEKHIALALSDDVGDSKKKRGNGDREFLTTKRDLAAELKRILGPDNWAKYKIMFPILKEYWNK